jgi:hypothetical protein
MGVCACDRRQASRSMTGRARLLVVLDLGLIGLAAFLGVQVYRVWGDRPPDPEVASSVASRGPQAIPEAMLTSAPLPRRAMVPATSGPWTEAGFDVIAEQNLFSPTRREAGPVSPSGPIASRPGRADTPRRLPSKPYLYGIVLGAPGGARAYLKESAATKLSGYGVGETVGGRVLQEIGADHVVLRETDDELVYVFLRDPSKPRPVVRPPPLRASRSMRPVRR